MHSFGMIQISINDARSLQSWCTKVDCSQPSIFYFYLIIERADRIAREPDTSTKGDLTWLGTKENKGAVDIFGKKRKEAVLLTTTQ